MFQQHNHLENIQSNRFVLSRFAVLAMETTLERLIGSEQQIKVTRANSSGRIIHPSLIQVNLGQQLHTLPIHFLNSICGWRIWGCPARSTCALHLFRQRWRHFNHPPSPISVPNECFYFCHNLYEHHLFTKSSLSLTLYESLWNSTLWPHRRFVRSPTLISVGD